jgi:UDP-N-acetylglucosamine 2-epimerase (non-hydrolysing)
MKILLIFGTRPEAIKMAPIFKEFKNHNSIFEVRVCVTAQHREMLDPVLDFFEITPDYDLDLMKPNQNLFQLTSDILLGLKKVIESFTPDYIFVHGDTTTTMAASLAGFYSGTKVCHIEAGLRTNNLKSPFPEEMNRQVTSRIANFHFAPTQESKENLIKENINKDTILITGNTVIDALKFSSNRIQTLEDKEIIFLKKTINPHKKIILVTAHRRENFGIGFINICEALKEIAIQNKEIEIIFPVHLNPNVSEPVNKILGDIENVKLLNPLGYPAFVWLLNKCYLIITDSGGIQEEAISIGKPTLVLRNETERKEAITSGGVILVGVEKNKIISECNLLLNDFTKYNKMTVPQTIFGDGKASEKIVKFIINQHVG